MTTRKLALGLISILAFHAFGCGEDPPPPPPSRYDFPIEVQTEDSDKNPLVKVPVTVDGTVVGYTDADGKFTGSLKERAGEAVTVGVRDIDGYRFPGDETSVTENLRVTTVNGEESGVPVFLQVTAESLEKDYFVWVRAKCEKGLEADDCSGLEVSMNGEKVGETNRFGYAHFSFRDVPQNDVEVSIDTPSGEQKFEPASPMYAVTLDLDSHVYLIDEAFGDPEFEERKPVKRRRVQKKRGGKKKSSGKTTSSKKTSGKKKPKDTGVIDLW